METKANLAKAIIAVMKEVSNVEKSMNVGTGSNSYKGVSDKDVKLKIGRAMEKHGLTILPIGVDAKSQIDRWEETTEWNGKPQIKTKQSVFIEVTTQYLLLHESGESQVIAGYGNGVDTQDKAAGKATTYALKNALLYSFMVPTGEIDDADKTHSDDIPVPQRKATPKQIAEPPIEDRVANMQGTKKAEPLTEAQLKAHAERIKLLDTATACAKYYNALTADLKENEDLKKLLAAQRDSLVVKKEAA